MIENGEIDPLEVQRIERDEKDAAKIALRRMAKTEPESLREVLSALEPEERLQGLKPQERLEGLAPEQEVQLLKALQERHKKQSN